MGQYVIVVVALAVGILDTGVDDEDLGLEGSLEPETRLPLSNPRRVPCCSYGTPRPSRPGLAAGPLLR